MRKKAFTLVELLTVIAIIGILYTILMPVAVATRNAAYQYSAAQTIRQLGTAMMMYAADNEDAAPLSIYPAEDGYQMWFGYWHWDRTVDTSSGLMSSYMKGTLGKDKTHEAKPWCGDMTGFGYNWGHIGSDYHERTGTGSMYGNAVRLSQLARPTDTVGFATSSYFNALWLRGGDGQVYDSGFITEKRFWHGIPTVDFRHQGKRVVDAKLREVRSDGFALLLFMDSHVKPLKEGQLQDRMFLRDPPPE
jgi:prepilin-type N-terminal cleavage/methylation domain-containing protein